MPAHRFRWVFCQLEVLRHCFPANLRRTLEELPKSLDETYMRILKEINNANREHAHRLLQCLLVARYPLRVDELADVLSVDFNGGGVPQLNADWRWEDQEVAVLSACSSLVSVIGNVGSRVVQFSHFSVKEFLTSDRLANCLDEVSRFHIPTEPSHAMLAHACLGALLRLDDRSDEETVINIPLFRYADKHWVGHAQFGNVKSRIKDAMEYFFDMDKPHFSAWCRIQRQYSAFAFHVFMGGRLVPLPETPLHLAAEWGFRDIVEHLIFKLGEQANHLGHEYCTPLHMSVYGGHIDIAQFLFAHGADINSCSADDLTPLHIASDKGRLEIAEWLLNHGADVNFRREDGRTPLHLGANKGHLEIARILLKHNAEVNTSDNRGATPFFGATASGNPDVVRLLLDYHVDAHVHDKRGVTPLHNAAASGHLEVAQILLELNAEVNARDVQGATPLLRASNLPIGKLGNMNTELIQLLLVHNADVHVHDNQGATPLHHAALSGQLEVVRMLLECNAEVNAQDDRGMTPLHKAAHSSCGDLPEVVQLLLDHNANVHIHDNDGKTPLHDAAFHGRLNVVQILLGANAEVNSLNNEGSTPLHQASTGMLIPGGNPDVVRILLDYGADVQVRNHRGQLASEVAWGPRRREIYDLLPPIPQHSVERDGIWYF